MIEKPSMAVSIELASTQEAELVRALSAAAYVPAYLAVIGAVPKPASEDYTDRIAQGLVWLAREEIDGIPVGVLVLDPAPTGMLVYSVAVDPRYQGKGCGKALLDHAERVAWEDGYSSISLYTNKRMVRNVALYLHAGYAVTGERAHPSREGETLLDMTKHLR